MNCDESRALLHGYLDGELDSSGSMAFEAHLASCQDCSKEFRRYQDLGAAVRNTAEYFTAPQALGMRSFLNYARRPDPQFGDPSDRLNGEFSRGQSPRC